MEEISNNDLKQIQIDILQHVNDFCHKYNIVYSLAYGTLIGAVRHKGYIPWDDDIDIVMTRSEYNKFLMLYKNKDTSKYKIYNYKTCSSCTIPYTKVFDDETLWLEDVENKVEIGVNIDVFPLDKIPIKDKRHLKILKKIRKLKQILMLKQVSISSHRNPLKNAILILGHFMLKKVSIYKIVKKIDTIGLTFSEESLDNYSNVVWTPYGIGDYVTEKDIGNIVRLPFENTIFDAYEGYDRWLRGVYNDYLQLPPKEKQITHHAFKAYWKHH